MKKFSVKNALTSAFFGALGPYFNKQAKFDNSGAVYHWFDDRGYGWAVYVFDVLMIILMLWANTISVKYKMLSYKQDGAFIGTTMIFILGYIFSSGFDYLYDQKILPLERILGALLIILGILMISWQEEEDKVKKVTNSVLVFVPQQEEHDDPDSAVNLQRRLQAVEPHKADPAEEQNEGLIDKSVKSGASISSASRGPLKEPLVEDTTPENDHNQMLQQQNGTFPAQ